MLINPSNTECRGHDLQRPTAGSEALVNKTGVVSWGGIPMVSYLDQIMVLFGLKAGRKLEKELKDGVGLLAMRHRCVNYSQL